MSLWCVWTLTALFFSWNQVVLAEMASNGREKHATALLLELRDGPAGAEHLHDWVTFTQSGTADLPTIWVVCSENSSQTALVRELSPTFEAFIVEDNMSWETVLAKFARQVRHDLARVLGKQTSPFGIVKLIDSLERACTLSSLLTSRSSCATSREQNSCAELTTQRSLLWLSAQKAPATVFGLLGAGVLPATDLDQSIANVEKALAGRLTPTVVITRSQSKRYNGATTPQWLPDTFISQIWCNGLVMTSQVGFPRETVRTSTLRGFLPKLISSNQTRAEELDLVDGTYVVPSVLGAEESESQPIAVGNAMAAHGSELRIGTLALALLRSDNGTISIGAAPWPPQYVSEHVATRESMIIVSSVNCGYLDFAINFLLAARTASGDVKVTAREKSSSLGRSVPVSGKSTSIPVCGLLGADNITCSQLSQELLH